MSDNGTCRFDLLIFTGRNLYNNFTSSFMTMTARTSYRVPILKPAIAAVGCNRYIGCIGNISSSGIFLHTTEKLNPGDETSITFTLPGGERSLSFKGVVEWTNKSVGGKQFLRGSGIKFTSISPEEKEMIEQFIASEAQRL